VPPECKPMTESDPCFKQCGPGMNCTSAVCKKLGKIGCNATQCELMGKSGDPSAHCMSPMGPKPVPPECKPMTESDPCFKQCGPGMNCTDAVCKKLGKIGCNATQCELMGKSGDPSAHCMSPTGPAPAPVCKPMTESDPCFQKCGPGKNCTAAVCMKMGKIGCNKTQCELMGKDGDASAHCMSPTGPTHVCVPMTEFDPCFKKCGPSMNCTSATCKNMGKIGCNSTQCVLMGKSGGPAAHCMSPMGPRSICKPMTESDPCFKKCGKNCTATDCQKMGKIGCNSTQCAFMGKSGNRSGHCMSPVVPLVECKPMTQSDPCFRQCSPGMNCTAAVCAHLGKIGCDGMQCRLMGQDGAASAHCMSPIAAQGTLADAPIFRSDVALTKIVV